jgi:hypothetical protein
VRSGELLVGDHLAARGLRHRRRRGAQPRGQLGRDPLEAVGEGAQVAGERIAGGVGGLDGQWPNAQLSGHGPDLGFA